MYNIYTYICIIYICISIGCGIFDHWSCGYIIGLPIPLLSGMHPTAPINKRRNATWPWPTNWDAKWLSSSPLVGDFNNLEK